MYANIRSNLGQGIHTKHVMPRFPVTLAETERLLGFTVVVAYGCQEASGSLVGQQAVALTLAATGTPKYRQPVLGLAEVGALADSSVNSGWTNANPVDTTVVLPDLTSFFWLTYHNWNGTASAADFCLGVVDANDGAQFLRVFDSTTQHNYNANDGVNSKAFVKTPTSVPSAPHRKGGTARAFLYDVGDGLAYLHGSGSEVSTSAMGAWLGLSAANVTVPWFSIGNWPGTNGSGNTTRFAIVAKGVQLDGKGPSLAAIMRRFGWQ
jgi:hypothetical protein